LLAYLARELAFTSEVSFKPSLVPSIVILSFSEKRALPTLTFAALAAPKLRKSSEITAIKKRIIRGFFQVVTVIIPSVPYIRRAAIKADFTPFII
jgi:hypothetical protein